MSRKKILVVTGPTASGKTALSIRLAEALGGEIVNADSVQVYRGFRIGAGAPDAAELARVPHHLFGVKEPADEWNAGLFREAAGKLIEEMSGRGALPIVAGGTGLYIRSLLSGLVEAEAEEDAVLELEAIEAKLELAGKDKRERTAILHSRLAELDPESAREVRASDSLRVRRALLVALSGGSLASSQREHAHLEREYDAMILCLMPEREALYRTIDERVDEMLAGGFLDEVRELLGRFSGSEKPFHAIGYKEAVKLLRGELDEPGFRAAMKQATRRFAKRQETWWRHQPEKLGWIREGAGFPDLAALLAAVRHYLRENTADPGPVLRFYRLSGVGFLENLG